MGFWNAFFGGCDHEYEKIAELKDSEDNTKSVKTVYTCRLCLKSVEKVFTAPSYCNHEWKLMDSVKLNYPDGRRGSRYKQQCIRCGDLRKVDLI